MTAALRWVVCTPLLTHLTAAASPADYDTAEVWPGSRAPTKKEAADSGASLEQAMAMPWWPTHSVVCNDSRPCRPGEGNLKGYRFWGQPYIHMEDYVQSRLRRPPHEPNPKAEYARLCTIARRVQIDRLVVVAAADWDWRRIILNWVIHAHRLGYSNAIVLSMDEPLHADLHRRGIPSFDDSANLDAWNVTCLQRHIQQVRMERVLAVAALLSGGFDVLHTDATAIFVRDFVQLLKATPNVDLLAQREGAPPDVLKRTWSGVNSGFIYLRATKSEAMLRFLGEVVKRGLVEFYHRRTAPHSVLPRTDPSKSRAALCSINSAMTVLPSLSSCAAPRSSVLTASATPPTRSGGTISSTTSVSRTWSTTTT